MFEDAFRGSDTSVRNIRELGPAHANAHFTHDIDDFIREGGCTPAIWTRSNRTATRLLGITFMREPLGIYVRTDDSIDSVRALAGKAVALPVWPQLVFDFWRVAAHKGLKSALDAHDMRASDVEFVDVLEDEDPHRRLNLGKEEVVASDDHSEYSGQLHALLNGEVDAFFAKGAESAIVVRQSGGRIRKLYDVNNSADIHHHVNNSTPRLLTCSDNLLNDHPQVVQTYLSEIVGAAQWAKDNPESLQSFVARECSIRTADIDAFFPAGYENDFLPLLSDEFVDLAWTMKEFMLEHDYIEGDFAFEEWVCAEPIQAAISGQMTNPVPERQE
jgi:sulfonate transport system substrate-binding protein